MTQQTSINWNNNTQQISKYFTVGEVTKGDHRRIPRSGGQIEKNILSLARELDRIREDWGSPIVVTSWYRPPAVNAAVGGVPNSHHIQGHAADIRPSHRTISIAFSPFSIAIGLADWVTGRDADSFIST